MKKKQSAKAKKKPATIASAEVEPAPIANTEKKGVWRGLIKMLHPGDGKISLAMGLDPTRSLKLKLMKTIRNVTSIPIEPFFVLPFPSMIERSVKDKLDLKPVNVYEQKSAESYAKDFYENEKAHAESTLKKLNQQKSAESYGKEFYEKARAHAESTLEKLNQYESAESYAKDFYENEKAHAESTLEKINQQINIDDARLPWDEIPTVKDPEAQTDAEIELSILKTAFFAEDGIWLRGCRKAILAAVDTGNEKFFLDLARKIRERPEIRGQSRVGRGRMRKDDPLPKPQTDVWRRAIAEHWVEWPLWLMTDAVGCEYLNKFCVVMRPMLKNEKEKLDELKKILEAKQAERYELYVAWVTKGKSKKNKQDKLKNFCLMWALDQRIQEAKLAELKKLSAKWTDEGKSGETKLNEIKKLCVLWAVEEGSGEAKLDELVKLYAAWEAKLAEFKQKLPVPMAEKEIEKVMLDEREKFLKENQFEEAKLIRVYKFVEAKLELENYKRIRKDLGLKSLPGHPVGAFTDEGYPETAQS